MNCTDSSPKGEYEQFLYFKDEQGFTKMDPGPDGFSEWVCPDPSEYLMKCCDCGLVHEAQFRVAKYQPKPSGEYEVIHDEDMQAQFRMRRQSNGQVRALHSVDCLGLALDLEDRARYVESQTTERAMLAAASALRMLMEEGSA